MSLTKLKSIYRMFSSSTSTRSQRKHNVKSYIRSLDILGERYILAKPIKLVKRVAVLKHSQQ